MCTKATKTQQLVNVDWVRDTKQNCRCINACFSLITLKFHECGIIMWYNDFPYWLRFAHFINLIFLTLLIRSGIEILSAMPKLYWHDHATPGTEWIKFTKKVFPPDIKERIWISLEEEESFSSWIALPGHKNLGIGRFWHFFSIIFWIANGAAYYILLFTSDE